MSDTSEQKIEVSKPHNDESPPTIVHCYVCLEDGLQGFLSVKAIEEHNFEDFMTVCKDCALRMILRTILKAIGHKYIDQN